MEEKIKKAISHPLEKLNMVVDSISFEKGNLNIVLDSDETIEEKLGESQDMLLKKKLLKEALADLSDRERLIVQKRFLTDNPETLEDLGLEFHISRERVRQIETKAYQKISKAIHAGAAKYAL